MIQRPAKVAQVVCHVQESSTDIQSQNGYPCFCVGLVVSIADTLTIHTNGNVRCFALAFAGCFRAEGMFRRKLA